MMPGQDYMVGAENAHSDSVMISVMHLLSRGTMCSWKSSASYILLVIQLEKGKAFRVLNMSIKWPDFILVCLNKKVTRITPFPTQTTIVTIPPFFPLMAHSSISSSFKLSCGTLLSISALPQVKMVKPGFIPSDNLQQDALNSCITSVQKKSVATAFLPLCVYLPAFIPLSKQTP